MTEPIDSSSLDAQTVVVCAPEDLEHAADALPDVCCDCGGGIWRQPHVPAVCQLVCIPCVISRVGQMTPEQRQQLHVRATKQTIDDLRRGGFLPRLH